MKSLFEKKINLNQAASNLAEKKSSRQPHEVKDFYSQKGAEPESYGRQTSELVIAKLLSFRGWQAGDLTSTDLVILN